MQGNSTRMFLHHKVGHINKCLRNFRDSWVGWIVALINWVISKYRHKKLFFSGFGRCRFNLYSWHIIWFYEHIFFSRGNICRTKKVIGSGSSNALLRMSKPVKYQKCLPGEIRISSRTMCSRNPDKLSPGGLCDFFSPVIWEDEWKMTIPALCTDVLLSNGTLAGIEIHEFQPISDFAPVFGGE